MKIATESLTLEQLLGRLCPIYEGGTTKVTRVARIDAILEFISDKTVPEESARAFRELETNCLLLRMDTRSDDLYCRVTESLVQVCELLAEGLGVPVRQIMNEA